MANTKKKTKTTRITKTDRLRMAAEKTRPTGITVAVGRQYEVEIVPMYVIRSNVPTIASVKPYTPLEVIGRDLYIREGCVGCH